ncbi:unnamed protein product [marine sediment metagenome]|uniref:Uncharacterized protein n=1 Tax=marine sediment metagenome TaxID=412755 RepID=X0YBP8_9ZZZZ
MSFVSSYIPTAGAAVERAEDQLNWTITSRPQAATYYVRLVEAGSIFSSSFPRILEINNGSGGNPRFYIIQNSNGKYRVGYVNAEGTTVTSDLTTAPTVGDVVELRATLSSAGVVQIHQSINSGTETSAVASSTQVLPTAWSGTQLWLNSRDTTQVGFNKFLDIVILRDIQSLATMRRIARAV